ncbi:Hypothetical predicted protein, partial [Paramuricea clavata]
AGRFMIDSGSPITIIPISDQDSSNSWVDSGLRDASGNVIRTYGKCIVNVPIDGKNVPFEASRCNVVRPILGRDFFKGPGKHLLIDLAEEKLVKRNNHYECLQLDFNKIATVCALDVPRLNPLAKTFWSSSVLGSARREAQRLVDVFCENQEIDGISPALFAPIRIETGDQAPIFSKSRPLCGDKATFVERKLHEMVEGGILEEVTGPIEWASPIHVAPKKGPDGQVTDFRLC